jgi:enoyl-CoA hydratase/carnithine racemase
MHWETISCENQNEIAILTLNRPESLNAMTSRMGEEFAECVDCLKNDHSARTLIIRGQGRSFCSGGDIKDAFPMYGAPMAEAQQNAIDFYNRFLSVRSLDIPTIAMIHGHTSGAGLCLAMACDMRIASTDTKLSMSFIKVGLCPGMGGSYLMPQLIGTAKAMEMCMLGDSIDAQQALQIGLVNHVIDPGQLMEFSLAFAGRIAKNPAVPVRLIKKAIYQGLNKDIDAALAFEAFAQVACFSTGNVQEAINAFKEKRPPVFK